MYGVKTDGRTGQRANELPRLDIMILITESLVLELQSLRLLSPGPSGGTFQVNSDAWRQSIIPSFHLIY
jgi:hypothetical protein